ncbi:YciI family protein [Actinomadura roseirufa]|uniref:YciI family protein n=1 Tax=Actinomadura roseirufa TaxID=2094049 RepID=UPI0010413914|nr:hypothetical protein [Actinomadura roseirufa]
MKFVLNLYRDRAAPRGADGDHRRFLAAAHEAGELIGGHVLADPSHSVVVRVRDGVTAVVRGPRRPAPGHLAEQYLLDCESLERAVELAALIAGDEPGEESGGVEVRPLMNPAGLEM